MKKTSTALCGLLSGLLLMAAGTLTTQAALSILSIGGSLEGGVLDEFSYFGNPSFASPVSYSNTPTVDIINNSTGNGFTTIVAIGSTLSVGAIGGAGGVGWTLTGSGTNSEVTLTGLNAASDNWLGFTENTNNAATFVNSDSIVIDLAVLGIATPGTFTLTAVPEPSRALLSLFGIAAIGLRRRRS